MKTDEIIAEFAKANKISRAKVAAFAAAISEVASAGSRRGIQASDAILDLREKLAALAATITQPITTGEVVQLYGCSQADAGNTLRYLEWEVVGKKSPTGKGKPANLWMPKAN